MQAVSTNQLADILHFNDKKIHKANSLKTWSTQVYLRSQSTLLGTFRRMLYFHLV